MLLLASSMLACGGCAEPELSAEELMAIEAQATELAQALHAQALRAHADADADGVTVRLMFGEDVDLDLYVTDPLLETVYFARHESRTGGAIAKDVRCDSSGPRVEEIRFPDPWPGRYRVGVDFPHRCDGAATRAPAPYAVSVTANGATHETHGLVNREFFEVVVLEFEISGPQRAEGDS